MHNPKLKIMSEYRDKVFAYIDKEDLPRPVTYQLDMMQSAALKIGERGNVNPMAVTPVHREKGSISLTPAY